MQCEEKSNLNKYEKIWNVKNYEIEYSAITDEKIPVGTKIFFMNGKHFETNIVDLHVIGFIQSSENIPFMIFSGRECVDCDMNKSIYIQSPLVNEFYDKTRYTYPGKIYDYENGRLVEDSRMFYGNCLNGKYKSIIWYSNYLTVNNKWEKEMYEIEFKDLQADLKLQKYNEVDFNNSLKFSKNGSCIEVKGYNRTSEP